MYYSFLKIGIFTIKNFRFKMLRIASFATSNGDQGEAATSNSNGQDVSVPESANLNGHLDDEVNKINNSTRVT